MANHSSALKRARQTVKRTLRNRFYKGTVRTAMKKAFAAAEDKSPDAQAKIQSAISMVDKVKGKGVLPANRAQRYASRLQKALNGLQAGK